MSYAINRRSGILPLQTRLEAASTMPEQRRLVPAYFFPAKRDLGELLIAECVFIGNDVRLHGADEMLCGE